ncbi:hypothetical protein [Tenacibaculum finnmarkense]|uniref:hypothetical protein n=1 Tax=Tenacibaculum finnmarkense TaxID=2781243 RepID=UPI001EFB3259|nr:hypothetical protein [Tenacibaculum finnmarkense]MCG8208450.1 hypothetical protein [Tenacibaculum finnmarkense genomovar finnmarkense]MCG8724390.1 hypothetical protein [Tenacibaculum finnmarkense]MCG8742708.1 hypothetical protein [Tenacibaculum finnmarkense]MCG8766113.1 hypothetical protein [Tenacibaculum finnmarkense]MCG8779068.1 hypothetical protein [Tenacibaculum finnmarkense]
MKNLNDFGVQELRTKEMENIDGGFFFILYLMFGERAGIGLERSGFNSAGANK